MRSRGKRSAAQSLCVTAKRSFHELRTLMQKLWVVLKVSLTRPWVWLMLFAGLCQSLPFFVLTRRSEHNMHRETSPSFDQPDQVLADFRELLSFNRDNRLSTVEGLNVQYIPDGPLGDDNQESRVATLAISGDPRVHQFGEWRLFDKLTQLKSLTMQPPNTLSPAGWKRIGQLSQLEVLSLENVGAVDQAALKTASSDLEAALSRLPKLRQLNLRNIRASNWTLPPLPNLEYVVLSWNLKLENTLEALAKHSPKLHTVALSTYPDFVYTERMLVALRQMPNLRQVYVASTSHVEHVNETQRQVEFLRTRLPKIAIHRGGYSLNRIMICGYLLLLAGFLPFVAWFQSGLTLSQPLAAVMPGHRRPHLFWPVGISLLATMGYVVVAMYVGVKLPPALAIACLISTLVATVLPGHDIRPEWRRITRLVSMVDALSLFTLLGLGLGATAKVDGFLMGDYPALANLLMVWFLFAAGWKFVRATRLHRILAESGMPGIPGLNLGMQQMYDQPFKPAPGWSLAGWQLKWMENSIDRRISGMDRTSWTDMLRAGSPATPGVWYGVMMVVVMVLVHRLMSGMQLSGSPLEGMLYALGIIQGSILILTTNARSWIGRRGSIAADFLLPVSREKFWVSLRMAIFHDLKSGILFGWVGGLFAVYQGNQGAISAFSMAVTIVSVIGYFAFHHAWVTRMVISKRLWLDATLAVATSMVITGMAIGSVTLTFGEHAFPPVAILLAAGVLISGGIMQWDLARKLPDWELG